MKNRFQNPRNKWWLTCGLVGILGLAALVIVAAAGAYFYFYGNLPSAPAPETAPMPGPAVTIQQPAPGAQFTQGDSFIFFASANDLLGVIRLDLWVDGTLILSQSSPDAAGLNPLSLSYPMVAAEKGSYALIARAYNSRGEFGESVVHYVTVVEPSVSASTQEYAQYVVQEGDTLENIAARLGVSKESILTANPQIVGGQVVPGQIIRIPMPKQAPPQAAVPGPNGVQPVAVPGGGQPGGAPVPPQQGPAPVPPNPPPAANQPSITIMGHGVLTSPVYYGQSCATEPRTTEEVATIEPPGAVQSAAVKYAYYGKAGSSPVLTVPMAATGGSNFTATIDAGGEAEQYLAQDGGAAVVWLEVVDTNGQTSVSQPVTLIVNFCPSAGGLPGNLPGILPQFMPGAPQQNPGIANVDPSLFPAPGNVVFNPPNSNLTAPQDVKATAQPPECRISVDWSDAQNETAYRVDRYEFGKPNPKTMADMSADGDSYSDDSLPQPGKYGYRVTAIQEQGGNKISAPSAIVWVDLPSSEKCKPRPEFKRIHFQPVSYTPNDASLDWAFAHVTIADLPTIRVPRGQQTSYPVSGWGDDVLEFSSPAPEQVYNNPGASIYLEVQGNGTALNVPPVNQGQFAVSHPMADLITADSKTKIWLGKASGFELAYKIWLEDWLWNGQSTNSNIPAPVNLTLDSSDPSRRILTWDYNDPTYHNLIDGFIVYRQYTCPGGDSKMIYPLVAGKNQRGIEIASRNEPVGCACEFTVSAFGGIGESPLSAPPRESCSTAAPAEGVEITFVSLKTDASLLPGNSAFSMIHLFANEFARNTRNMAIENGKTYPLDAIPFDGKAGNNRILVGVSGNAQTVTVNFGLPHVCLGNGLVISKQGNSWARTDGQNYFVTSADGKCVVEVAVKDHAAWQGGQAPGGQPAPGGAPPPPVGAGNGTVRFVNKSSHPILALEIDGVDVIQTEAQIIPTGGWLDALGVTPGDHAYAPTNGFMSGGVPQLLLPLPVGRFSGNTGTVAINDPTLGELLTNYGSGGAFVGDFWQETQYHYAGFCFNAGGGFTFHIDGQQDDTGTYTFISRQTSVYSVTFHVLNSAGTEKFEGTYYYAGPFAGEMQMRNGPPGWELITYVRDVRCP